MPCSANMVNVRVIFLGGSYFYQVILVFYILGTLVPIVFLGCEMIIANSS